MQIETRIDGIPCLVDAVYFRQKPNRFADSDHDYMGYEEIEYTVLDLRGKPAAWLERKITEQDDARICEEIARAYE